VLRCLALDRAHPQGTTFLRSSHIKVYDCLPDVGDYGTTRAKALGEIGVARELQSRPLQYMRYTLALVCTTIASSSIA
jgi:hypothetical protein